MKRPLAVLVAILPLAGLTIQLMIQEYQEMVRVQAADRAERRRLVSGAQEAARRAVAGALTERITSNGTKLRRLPALKFGASSSVGYPARPSHRLFGGVSWPFGTFEVRPGEQWYAEGTIELPQRDGSFELQSVQWRTTQKWDTARRQWKVGNVEFRSMNESLYARKPAGYRPPELKFLMNTPENRGV